MALPDGFRSIDELPLAHQRVLIRVDFDVALDARGNLTSDRKLRAALPTIRKALGDGARVVLATHLGSPDQAPVSLEPVAACLAELLGQEIYLPDECVGDAARKVVSDLREGQLCLLENLRFAKEEAQNEEVFARKLMGLCDVYVAEAFGVAHLSQASTVSLPRLMPERGLGYRFQAELESLSRVASSAPRPFVGILGGESLAQRLTVLEVMLRSCDAICVGGAIANTLLAARGVAMKDSAFEPEQLPLGRALLGRARDQKVDIVLPVDVMVGADSQATTAEVQPVGAIPDGTGAFDVGPKTLASFCARVAGAKTVLWHGALGVLENPVFSGGTQALWGALAEAPAFGVLVGDSLSTATAGAGPELEQKIGLISMSGAASLIFIEGKQLPGVLALRG